MTATEPIRVETYTFTGFYSSGNPFLWYYDESKRTMFMTSQDVEVWEKKPEKGDTIELHRDPSFWDYRIVLAKINGIVVFKYSAEAQNKKELSTAALYDNLKKQKGFL